MPTLSVLQVQARWAYSEIVDGTLSRNYDGGPNIEELRARRRDGVPLDQLSPQEEYNLAFLCVMTRPNLMIFLTGVDRLVEVRLNRAEIATLLVPGMISDTRDFTCFDQLMNTTAKSPKDPRNVLPPPEGYQSPADPLTLGRFFDHPVLLDGYHRAALLWNFAPPDTVIHAYVPVQFIPAPDPRPNLNGSN
jgi:hypothetical protein